MLSTSDVGLREDIPVRVGTIILLFKVRFDYKWAIFWIVEGAEIRYTWEVKPKQRISIDLACTSVVIRGMKRMNSQLMPS